MIKNYLLIFFRNIARKKMFTLLNVGGFAIGMAACMLIILFINNEKSFDVFHSKADRIYRLNEWQRYEGMQEQQVALSMYPMGPMLQKDHPEVESFVRVYTRNKAVLRNPRQELSNHNVYITDSNFFNVFDFPLLDGNKDLALLSPTAVVITETAAKKMFNTTDAIGKIVELKRGSEFVPFTVSAVAKDVSPNSHLQFDMIASLSGLPKQPWMDTWETNWLNTYLLLRKNADASRLAAALPAFEKKYLKDDDKFYELFIQPLLSIHLGSGNITHDENNYKKFSYSYIKTFMILAMVVLLIAVFNFVNLSTAVAVKRSKEAGIRKTIGAGKWQLIRQFIVEAVLFSLISFALAILISFAMLPLINQVFERSIGFNVTNPALFWTVAILSVIGVGVLSGLYPAFAISKYKPITMVKGMAAVQSRHRLSLRPVLVVLQFTIAVGLIISTIVITQQLRFAQKKDVGFDKEQVLLVGMNSTANKNFSSIKNDLLSNSGVEDVTAYNERLGGNINQWGADYISDKGETKHVSVSHIYVDYNYISFFKIPLVEGRNFSTEFTDTAGYSYLINEALAKELETKKPVGARYKIGAAREMGNVIGVVKDFNFNSIHHKVAPLYMSMQNWNFNEMAIRLKPGNTASAISAIENIWKKQVPDMPFAYNFLDEHMNGLYKADQQTGLVVNIATMLAIVIACLGLFGMALYTIASRTKEIGIRKVLGATVHGITFTLSKDFLRLVLIAAVLAVPLAWFIINKWLEDFAFRVNVSWWVFVAAGLAALLVAMVTVSFQAIRAAIVNPVKSLRTE